MHVDNDLRRRLRRRKEERTKGRKLSDEQKLDLLRRYADGEDAPDLALAFKVSLSTVRYHIRRATA